MKNRAVIAFLVAAVLSASPVLADYYLFTSFRGNGEDGLHLAVSTNGYHWQDIGNSRSFLKPEIGAKLLRDPSIARGPDGVFHLVWTSGWTTEQGKVIGYASSKDLLHWTAQKPIPLMAEEPGTRNIWAPEIFYDSGRKQWLIYWSSTIPGKFADTEATGDSGYNHRFYFATTPDFEAISPSRLLYDPGFNCIDLTLFQDGKRILAIFKDERKTPLKKNLRLASAADPQGPFRALSEPFTTNWVEGPSALKIENDYLVYFDHYSGKHYYGAVRSRDLKTWEDCSDKMHFPAGHRHGSAISIPEELAKSLLELK